MYAYGWIVSIHISRAGNCAFVEFANREMAEHAAKHLYNALSIRGKSIAVNWSKGRATAATTGSSADIKDSADAIVMPPPPGMEHAPVSAYSILNHSSSGSSADPTAGDGTTDGHTDAAAADDSDVAVGTKRSASEQLPKPPRPLVYPSTDPTRLGAS